MDSKNPFNEFPDSEPEYFKYADTDSYQTEIAELYSYTECSEFRQNYRAYVIEMDQLNGNNKWFTLDDAMQRNFIITMIDRLEFSNYTKRILAARCVLYLLQGCWMEADTVEAQQQCTRANVLHLYKSGAFSSFVKLLNMELERPSQVLDPDDDIVYVHVTHHNSLVLSVILNVMYIIVETVRVERDMGKEDFTNIAIDLVNELINPSTDEEMFPIKMLNMMTKYCNNSKPHYPIKKVILLLWKSTLFALGGTEVLKQKKNELRLKAGLPPIKNDTLDVIKCMQATILAEENFHMSRKTPVLGKRVKSASFESTDDAASYLKRQANVLLKGSKHSEQETELKDCSTSAFDLDDTPKRFEQNGYESASSSVASRSSSSSTSHSNSFKEGNGSALLFEPKVRNSDIERFLQNARQKFIGFTLDGDCETLIGLPKPILESVNALRRHLYISLGELQIIQEMQQSKNVKENKDPSDICSTEKLYQAMLPNMSDYVHDLLRLLQAAFPSAKHTAGNVNARLITDTLSRNLSETTIFALSMKKDVLRHKEIIIKAISAFLIIALKHFKLNHIYHSEYICQLMVQCNFIKQMLQSFAPYVNEYVHTMPNMPAEEFPAYVFVQEKSSGSAEATSEKLSPSYSWRNLFATVNLLRLLNKVVKWKPSRIVNMIFLKSVNTLKDSLRIQQPLLQVYVLKLLKMQAKFLGRNWRRHNLKVLTAIYTKVRPRFNDDWAYGCKTVGDFWGAQEDEMEAFANVKEYHLRRFPYLKNCRLGGFCTSNCNDSLCIESSKIDLSIQNSECNSVANVDQFTPTREKSVISLSAHLKEKQFDMCKVMRLPLLELLECDELPDDPNEDLPETFKKNYETWLETQVFNNSFDWDSI